MIDTSALVAEVVARTATVLSELKPGSQGGGVYEAERIERKSFERLPAVPYAVVDLQDTESSERLLNVDSQEFLVKVHYIAHEKAGVGGIDHVRDRLGALARHFWANDFTEGDLLDLEGLAVGPDHPANDVFITKGMPLVAGCLSARFCLSDTES